MGLLEALGRALLLPIGLLREAWRALVLYWLTAEKGSLGFLAFIALPLMTSSFAARLALADQARLQAERHRRAELTCLAENIYREARGEPLAGQHAVAEVTLNRVSSPRFPGSVCAVVHEARWDASRRRYVGAFSWTELGRDPLPAGFEWDRALTVATAVYDNREAPFVDGALFYHATRIVPAWSKEKRRVARIGRHVFYE